MVDKALNSIDKDLLNERILALKVESLGRRYTNFQAMEVLLIISYLSRNNELKNTSQEVFLSVAEDILKQAEREYKTKGRKPDREEILSFAVITGINISYFDYLSLLIETDYLESLRLLTSSSLSGIPIEDALNKLIEKQRKRIINVHDDKHSGALHSASISVGNQTYLHYGDEDEHTYVFIAVIDSRTSDMCRSLDGQKFSNRKMNEFTRYFQSSGFQKVRIKGLIEGINYPPIIDAIHNCRSTVQVIT